jgi:hypothetical protein
MKCSPVYLAMALMMLAGCDSPKPPQIVMPPKASSARACLPMPADQYNAGQVKVADFCSPGGEQIVNVTIGERDTWAISIHENRVAFGPVGDEPVPSTVVVTTPNNHYQFTLVR